MKRKEPTMKVANIYERALEWLNAESSANEGQSSPEIKVIRQLIKEAILGQREPPSRSNAYKGGDAA